MPSDSSSPSRFSGTSRLNRWAPWIASAGIPLVVAAGLVVVAVRASYDIPTTAAFQQNFWFGPVTQSMVVVQTLNRPDPVSRIDLRIRSSAPTLAVLTVRAAHGSRTLRAVTRRIDVGDHVYAFRFPTAFPTADQGLEFALTLPEEPLFVAAHSRDPFPDGSARVPGFEVDAGMDLRFRVFKQTSFAGVLADVRQSFEQAVAPAALVAVGAAFVVMVVALGVVGGAALRRVGIPRPYVTAIAWTLLILIVAAVTAPLINPALGSL